jgi:predicted amidohydrolase
MMEEYQKYEKVVTIAGVNWKGEWGNKKANLEKMKAKVREAAQYGINIIAFPELALTGYECGPEARQEQRQCAMHTEAAETVPGPSTEEMAKLAKELNMYVIFGMPEKDAKNSDVQYVSAALIGPEGVIGSYRKMHLATPPVWTEYYCFKPGNELPIFKTKYGPIGIQICADFWMYPELSRLLFLKGARIIFNPSGSAAAPGKIDLMVNETTGRGQSTQCYIVSCNHVGTERTISYYGHSTIGGPGFPKFQRTFARSEGIEEIVWATVSFETLAQSRRIFRVKEAGNWKLIAKEYQKIAEEVGENR